MADITTTQSRTSRISIMYGSMAISYPIASFISIYIYTYGGYFAIWGTSMGLGVITLLYVICFIKDSRGSESEEEQVENSYSPSVNFGQDDEQLVGFRTVQCRCGSVALNLWECFTVTFQPRNGYKRACLSILLASMCMYVFQSKLTPTSSAHGILTSSYLVQYRDPLRISILENYLIGTNLSLPCFQPFPA